jgi:alkaline phosphatase
VILLLSDGTAPEAWTLARWVKGQALAVDEILSGAVRTYGADSLITDSAPGATAYATGRKATDKTLSVGAFRTSVTTVSREPGLAYVPLVTLLEAARVQGFATGLVATSSIQHATPAAFSAHVINRDAYNEIAEQQAYQNIDIVLAGGLQYLLPRSQNGGVREDGEDLTAVLKSQGYQFVTTKHELENAPDGKLWGIFAPNDLSYEIERSRFSPEQPSLAEMTRHALNRLVQNEKTTKRGFFLFVEGSKVDWAAHVNDPVGVLSELLAFDEAVAVALTYAKSRRDTQVIVVSDHSTGGLTIGTALDPEYSRTDEAKVVTPLRNTKVTTTRLSQILLDLNDPNRIREVLSQQWQISDLSNEEHLRLRELLDQRKDPRAALSRIISTRARIGWTSNGHTGADVYLFAYGPEHPVGLVENTSIHQGIARFLNLPLRELQTRLFVDLQTPLTESGYAVSLDRSDPKNGQLVVSKGNRRARLPWAKNQVIIEEQRTFTLEGIVVFSEELSRVFGPAQALTIIRRELP